MHGIQHVKYEGLENCIFYLRDQNSKTPQGLGLSQSYLKSIQQVQFLEFQRCQNSNW